MNAARTRLTRPALIAGGLALAAVAAATPAALAGEVPAHNEQVVLHNGTDAQSAMSSDINGTAQVMSHDGLYVVFSTDAPLVSRDDNETTDVYLRSVPDGFTILVSSRNGRPGNDASFEPTISADGRWIAFSTFATNLARDTRPDTVDVVVKDMQQDRTRMVSVTSREEQRARNSFFPVISGNGRFVSFQTFGRLGPRDADRTEDVYVRDVREGTTRQVSLLPGGNKDVRGPVVNGDISGNGNLVVFGNDNMLWVRDVAAGRTLRFWHEPDAPPCQPFPAGSAGRPVISGNGKYVAFSSCATDLPGEDGEYADVYRMALADGSVDRVTPAKATGNSYLPSLSRNGQVVGFASEADDLVTGDLGQPDAFVADLVAGTLVRASQAPDGTGGNSWSATTAASISGDGHSLAYPSYADNLVPGDAYDVREVFAWRD